MVMWQITASVEIATVDGWSSSRQLPTFYLDSNIQGMSDEKGAIKVAKDLILASTDRPSKLHVTAIKQEVPDTYRSGRRWAIDGPALHLLDLAPDCPIMGDQS